MSVIELLPVEDLRRNSPIPVGNYVKVLGDTITLHYNEMGSRNDRPTLIFLPGSGPGASGYNNFKGNIPYFVERGYHSIALDYVGYGLSDKPIDFVYDIEVQAQAVHDVVTQLGLDRVVLIGNSLGGYIALAYALAHPERVEKLVLMASGGLEERTKWLPDSRGLAEMGKMVRARDFGRDAMRETLNLIVHDPSLLTEEVLDERLAIAASQPSEVWTNQKHSNVHERLGEITAPVLCFWGSHDQFMPVRHALLILEKIADARSIVSNRAGHWFMIEEEALFNSATAEFLGG
jgi:4,5:9,10-diseco-3-hydroxy-5,9,17-trioxoandrosta-1(10),2-diene-4-oate hydrolase